MGTFRLLLAVIVMLGHLAFYPRALPYFMPGPIAVEAFYVVSGFLITLVLVEKYSERRLLFYSDRALRLYPIYWLCLALYLLANVLVVYRFVPTTSDLPSTSTLWWSQNHPIDVPTKIGMALLNIFIVGQDVVQGGFGNPNDLFLHKFIYIRFAWSVAVEICFYAIAPFVVRQVWLTAALLALSLFAQSSVITQYNSHPFPTRGFPLSLWCFMSGALAYHAYARLKANKPRWLTSYSVTATAAAIALTMTYNIFSTPRPFYLFAVAACLPGLVFLGRQYPWDGRIGDLSYPLYLIHPLATIIVMPGKWGEYIAISGICSYRGW